MTQNITIYHNPRCSKSRQTLALLKERGTDPEIIRYLDNPPDRETLKSLLKLLGLKPRELMRTGEEAYKTSNLADETLSEETLIDAMITHPVLIQRPIVITRRGSEKLRARIGRPPEQVLEIL